MTKKEKALAAAAAAEATTGTATTEVTAPVQTREEAMAAFRAQLAGEICQYVPFSVGLTLDDVSNMPTNVVIAKNGLFRVSKTPIGYFATQLAVGDAKFVIPGVQEIKKGVTLSIPKIPFEYWLEVLSFYRDVYNKDKTEASLLFFWNDREITLPTEFTDGTPIKGLSERGQLIMYCPSQKNSSGLSNFTADTMVPWLRTNTTPLLETHSHHTMGAFWSSTDNDNENMNQFYGVYGEILKPDPKFLFRYVHGTDKSDIDFYELFEKPVTITQVIIGDKVIDIQNAVEYKGPWPNLEYPADWMEKHAVSYTVTPSYGGAAGGYGRGGQGGGYGQNNGYGYGGGASGYGRGGLGYDDDYVASQYRAGAGGTAGAAGQAKLLEFDESKKNTVDGEDVADLTDGVVKKVIETKTSTVEIVALQRLSPFSEKQIFSLCEELSEMGYDQVIHGTIQAMIGMTEEA
jgi:hypothetical protein